MPEEKFPGHGNGKITVFLKDDFIPCEPKEAAYGKIIYDDGRAPVFVTFHRIDRKPGKIQKGSCRKTQKKVPSPSISTHERRKLCCA
jgi:hypothetical protein